MSLLDLARYRVEEREPTRVGYRGLDVYSMGPSSGGGTTVGEALTILESADLSNASDVQHLHRFIESTKLAFADRNRPPATRTSDRRAAVPALRGQPGLPDQAERRAARPARGR